MLSDSTSLSLEILFSDQNLTTVTGAYGLQVHPEGPYLHSALFFAKKI